MARSKAGRIKVVWTLRADHGRFEYRGLAHACVDSKIDTEESPKKE